MSIHVRNLTKRFHDFLAVDDVTLEVASGELVAFLGPSGSGKSTILRIIAGLETADAGEIWFDGGRADHLHARARGVGFVFQHYALFRHMTVAENIAFGLNVQGARRKRKAARVAELLALMGLQGLGDRYPAQLSGGQRQRVALARALAPEPRVLLLDEPFGAVDAKVREELRHWLRRLHDEVHVTSIFVTHDQEEALEVADRVVLMKGGQIEQVGSPQEVWDHPASPFVYGFLGDVNLFHGRAHEGELHVHGMQIDVPEHSGAQDVLASAYVRPHDLEVARHVPGTASPAHSMVARLERAIAVGPTARLELVPLNDAGAELKPSATHQSADNAAPAAVIEAHISAQQYRDMGLKEGDTVVVTPRRTRVFLDQAAGI